MIYGQIPGYSLPKEIVQLNTIAHYLRPEDVLLDAEASSKPELLDAIGRHMDRRIPFRAKVFPPVSRGANNSDPPRWGKG